MKNETIHVGQIGIKFLLEAADTNGSVAMFEFTVPVGAKMPQPHSHKHYDETIYGVEGVITFTVEGKTVDIGPGGILFCSARGGSWFQQPEADRGEGAGSHYSGAPGPEFFKEAAAIVNAGGPPDVEKLKAVMAKYGLVPAMPPVVSR